MGSAGPGVTPEAHSTLKTLKTPNHAHIAAPPCSALLQAQDLSEPSGKGEKTQNQPGISWAHIRAASAYCAQSGTKINQRTLLIVWGMGEIVLALV